MMVVLVDLEMLSQLSNARAENRDLDLGGSGVTFVPLKLIDNLCFFLFRNHRDFTSKFLRNTTSQEQRWSPRCS
jgi:hypothetical protein